MSESKWTNDRPTEPGEYWAALHPDQRERLWASQPVMCVVINGHGGFRSVRWLAATAQSAPAGNGDVAGVWAD